MKNKFYVMIFILMLFVMNLKCQDLTNGLIGYWSFDGNANDMSGNVHNGVENGSITYEAGLVNLAAKLTAAGNYITLGSAINFNNYITISVWVKPSKIFGVYGGDIISCDYASFKIALAGNNIFFGEFGWQGSAEKQIRSNSISYQINTWNHIVVIYDLAAKSADFYFNGAEVGLNKQSILKAGAVTSGTKVISYHNFGYHFEGAVDELRLYDKALSETEISQLYNNYSFSSLTVTNGSGSGSYPANMVVTISADPPPAGHVFDKWIGNVTHLLDQMSSQTTCTMPSGNISITATYKVISCPWTQVGEMIYYRGNVSIGRTNVPSGFNFAVDGKILTKEVKVTIDPGNWSDFVFNSDYQLQPISDLDKFIKKNKHLPSIPSEKDVLENGIKLGEMDAKLLQKIEELTLYMIDLNKDIEALKLENQKLKDKLDLKK